MDERKSIYCQEESSMKKWLALVLTAALLAALFAAPAAAESTDLVKILASTPNLTSGKGSHSPTAQELDDAIDAGSELIPEGSALTPGRVTLLYTQDLSCEREVYDVSFKVWSTLERTVGLFFLAEGEDTWQLITCCQGDVIEGRFEESGTCAIVVGW